MTHKFVSNINTNTFTKKNMKSIPLTHIQKTLKKLTNPK